MFPRELAFLIASTANRAHLRKVKNAETGLAFDPARSTMIKQRFKVGDHVTWNSEAGRVSGRIIKVHSRDVNYKGYTRHASKEAPQYEIKSDKTDHIAMHKGTALKRVRG